MANANEEHQNFKELLQIVETLPEEYQAPAGKSELEVAHEGTKKRKAAKAAKAAAAE